MGSCSTSSESFQNPESRHSQVIKRGSVDKCSSYLGQDTKPSAVEVLHLSFPFDSNIEDVAGFAPQRRLEPIVAQGLAHRR